ARLLRVHGVRRRRRVLGPGPLEDGALSVPQAAPAAAAGERRQRLRGRRVQSERRRGEADAENLRGNACKVYAQPRQRLPHHGDGPPVPLDTGS
ncbi:unnamed protein product, partial [Ectocarpus sp. 12 AP-2014]